MSQQQGGCGCGCTGSAAGYRYDDEVELPADAFTSLRVSYGMLLGEADFDVLMGNPRGKGMLHAAWLHGSGLIWGYGVSWRPDENDATGGGLLRVEPGLAVDGWGRDLRLDRAQCLDLAAWAAERLRLDPAGGDDEDTGARTLCGWVVAEFATCLDQPVPALADPCDVTRRHEVCARVVETVRLRIREDDPPPPPPLGVDCEHLAPAAEDGDVPGLFPVTENDAGVVLGRLEVRASGDGDCVRLTDVGLTGEGRRVLRPGGTRCDDAGGPRLVDGSLQWSPDGTTLQFRLTAPALPGSQRTAVSVTSLSPDRWIRAGIREVTLHDDDRLVVVRLDRPPHPLARVRIRGTGDTPLLGRDPIVPFAGVPGGPPGRADEGHDAVLMSQSPEGD
jgi:hypothetical protein